MSETTTPEVTSQASPSVDTGTATDSPQVFDAEVAASPITCVMSPFITLRARWYSCHDATEKAKTVLQ
ncbi:MAG: hypothetical protein FWG08_04535 [Propionibacteriaceae bacterium]|nr:hypothetical protein [Propionibacteriaceae bacterium]